MNSTQRGDLLEIRIYDLFKSEIEKGNFLFKIENCKLYRKKGYYSKDRGANIIFDVSVEVYIPGATEYSILVLIECKNYKHPVPVDDVEEFFAKTQQISGANVKAIMATTASFNSGTLSFAKSKGIGLVRYFEPDALKWELMRSPSLDIKSADNEEALLIERALLDQDFVSHFFDLFFLSRKGYTNSFWNFMEDVAFNETKFFSQLSKIKNRKRRYICSIPFLEKEELEEKSREILTSQIYTEGEVSLDAICEIENRNCGLKIIKDVEHSVPNETNSILGKIEFRSMEIHIYKQEIPNYGRERFTLAHELAHHLLGHAKYMLRDSCDENDHALNRHSFEVNEELFRMEFQANYLAACLLMPRHQFIGNFQEIAKQLDIAKKGFGALYLDHQLCNLQTYMQLTGRIMQLYGVSRKAATIRLEGLGLLKDARPISGRQVFQNTLISLTRDYGR